MRTLVLQSACVHLLIDHAKMMGIAEFILRNAEGLHPSYILIQPTCYFGSKLVLF
jgi:hypothetical protein